MPAAPVEDLAPIEIVEERVDREVAAERVFVGLAEDVVAADEEVVDDVVGSSSGAPGRVAPEGGDLDDLAAAEEHVREAEAPADDAAVAEERAHVFGAGAGRDVEVLRASAEEEVADAAADEVRLEAAALEAANDLGGVGVDALFVEDDVVADEARPRVPLEPRSSMAPETLVRSSHRRRPRRV